LAVAEGATENSAVVKASLADLVERGLRPDVARLFIVDGAEALSRVIRDTFGSFALIRRCKVHKGRIIIERLDPHRCTCQRDGRRDRPLPRARPRTRR
jgi:putative transposase